MDRFADNEALVAVVETGSFTAAGDRLGVAKSVVSRRIGRLEQRLGVRLLHRTTRSLTLTDAGRGLYGRVAQILSDLDDAEQALMDETAGLRGRIRLAAPLSFGLRHLAPALVHFLAENPAIDLDLDLNDRAVNLVEEGFDLALRIGDLADSSLTARRIGRCRFATCASPAYLAAHGEPRVPADLAGHTGLQYSNVGDREQWQFEHAGRRVQGAPGIRMRANNGEVLADAAAAGLGLYSGPTFLLADYFADGRLVRVLRDFERPAVGIHCVFPPGRLAPRRVGLFADYLAGRFGDTPYWDAQFGKIPSRSS